MAALVPRRPGRQHVGVLLAAAVLDLADDRGEAALRVVAVVEAERVEDVAEEPREAQQQHPRARLLEPVRAQLRLDPGPQRRAVAGAVIALPEAQQVGPVDREQAQSPRSSSASRSRSSSSENTR